jgi:hypothetical protein
MDVKVYIPFHQLPFGRAGFEQRRHKKLGDLLRLDKIR